MGPFSLSPFQSHSSKKAAHAVSRGIASARRRGRHTYRHDWHFDLSTGTQPIAEALLAWARDTLATCRRPFGIDYFDLAISVISSTGSAAQRLALTELRPISLYGPSLEEQLSEFIERGASTTGQAEPHLRVSTSLFSWGDAAHEALPAS
jgi:hypothetical protein